MASPGSPSSSSPERLSYCDAVRCKDEIHPVRSWGPRSTCRHLRRVWEQCRGARRSAAVVDCHLSLQLRWPPRPTARRRLNLPAAESSSCAGRTRRDPPDSRVAVASCLSPPWLRPSSSRWIARERAGIPARKTIDPGLFQKPTNYERNLRNRCKVSSR